MPTVKTKNWEIPAEQNDILDIPATQAQLVEVPRVGTITRTEVGSNRNRNAGYTKIEAQFFDAYGIQREFAVEPKPAPGDPSTRTWVVSAYKHPGIPVDAQVSETVAAHLIDRLWELATKYPILLLNETGEGKTGGQAETFVAFHERLLAGAAASTASEADLLRELHLAGWQSNQFGTTAEGPHECTLIVLERDTYVEDAAAEDLHLTEPTQRTLPKGVYWLTFEDTGGFHYTSFPLAKRSEVEQRFEQASQQWYADHGEDDLDVDDDLDDEDAVDR